MKMRGIMVTSAMALVSLLLFFSAGRAQDTVPPVLIESTGSPVLEQLPPPQPQKAPLHAGAREPLPPGTGFIRPPMDLSHLTGQKMPGSTVMGALPDEFDWRDRGGQTYVTPVENQNPCGSCYAFGFLGSFESRLLIDGAGTFDFSQNHAKECNWRELNDFQYPNPGDYWGSCDGGNAFMLASLFSQTGTVLETCDPHVPSDVGCKGTCPYQKTLLDWRLINGGSVPDPQVLKQYLYDHGPIITSMDANAGQGFDGSYDGSHTFNYNTPGDAINHCVLIVGWSDNLPPVPGGTGPADGWIVRNSWGTNWGDGGYFYITYGAANIGSASSFVHSWQDYDSTGDVWYYDDDGWWGSWGFGNPTGWGLAKFIPDTTTNVTRVEFWTTDATTDVDVYVYDDFNGNTLSNKLGEGLNNAYSEAGYHSVELSSPVPVTPGDDVIAVAKFTNHSYGYPIPTDPHGNIETGRTYMSASGSSWMDMGATYNTDVAIRLRTSVEAPQAPSLAGITPSSGLNTGIVNIINLSGSNFRAGAMVKLTKSGQPDINATNVAVVNPSKITCDFDLAGAAAGSWHVVVTNPDARSGTLPNAFRVRSPGGQEHVVYLPLLFRNYPPVPDTPSLEPIDNADGDGSYTVRWSPAARANVYTLQECDNAALLNPILYPPTTNVYKAFGGKAPGTYYYQVKATNAWGDSGWSNVRPVTVRGQGGWETILDETFEGAFPGSRWNVRDGNSDSGLYYWDKRDCRDHGGSFSAWSVGTGDSTLSCGRHYRNDVLAWMVFGPFSLADATAAELIFDWWSDTEMEYDVFFWGASVDGENYYGQLVSGDWSQWTTDEVLDLSDVFQLGDLVGEDEVWIAFVFDSDSSVTARGSFVDNVLLRKYMGGAAGLSERAALPQHASGPDRTVEPVHLRLDGTSLPPSRLGKGSH